MRPFDYAYAAIVYPALTALLGALVVRDWRSGLVTVAVVAGVLAVPRRRA